MTPGISYDPSPSPPYTGVYPTAKFLGAPPISREFREWVLVCDNTRICVARYAFTKDSFAVPGLLSLIRQPGPEGRLRLTLMARDEEKAPSPGDLMLDGRLLGAFPWKFVEQKGQNGKAILEGEPARQFVQAIKDAQVLSLAGKAAEPIVPLDGMKAALLAMDEAQGRVDTKTALVRVGSRPVSDAPAAPSIPVVYARPARVPLQNPAAFAASVHAAMKDVLDTHECDLDLKRYDRAFALNDTTAFVVLGCSIGAYNKSVLGFLAPRNAPKRARLLLLPAEPGLKRGNVTVAQTGLLDWGDWDPKTATLLETAKGRGLADCGSRSSWTFDGKAFQLTRYDNLDRCSGGPEGDWPTLYRTRVVVK